MRGLFAASSVIWMFVMETLKKVPMRCDCNVSVRKFGAPQLGTKVEVKNVNSFRFVEKAIEYEVDRQIDLVERGERIVQETRLWDPDKNKTFSMRSKENAEDYRYFPDPDLLPVMLTDAQIARFKSELPELPLARAKRFVEAHGLPEYDAFVLTTERELARLLRSHDEDLQQSQGRVELDHDGAFARTQYREYRDFQISGDSTNDGSADWYD